ncbi:MAG TPA: hypothetical protein VFA06_03880 [Actinocrinis sp.]|uniref:hypothetical protein n=1 Tax=Actinocrinis sp. TaxID=1920516 RepID=UPI002D407280|nr:hypothetical protein [Actinocrinis sp.]HZU54989.1 hypothetical protein [Actinocrinis sp.]
MSNEDVDGWWFPAEPSDFTWGEPYDWQYSEPTYVRIAGDGLQALFACTADSSHQLITHAE